MTKNTPETTAIDLRDFFSATEARVDRWRTLNRVAKTLAGGGRPPASGSGDDPRTLLAEVGPLEALCAYPGPRLMTLVHERLQAERLDRLRAPGAADQRRAARQQLPGRPGALEVGGRGGRAPARRPPALDRPGPGPPAVLRDAVRLARRARHVAGGPRDLPAAAARRGRVHLRAGGRRQLRGRGSRRGLQPEPAGGGDQRRLRVSLAAHDPRAAGDPHPLRADLGVRPKRRSRHAAGPGGPPLAAGAGRLPHDGPRRRPPGRLRRRGVHPAGLLRRRGAHGDPPRDPRRRRRTATRLRTSTTSRSTPSARSGRSTRCRWPGASRSSSRTGSGTWASSTARTCSWPSRRRPPGASTACSSRPATSRWRRTRRRARSAATAAFFVTNGTSTSNKIVHQALVRARRHRADRPRLPQVAPLRARARGRASRYYIDAFPLTQYSMYGSLADHARSRRRCSSSRPRASSTGRACSC